MAHPKPRNLLKSIVLTGAILALGACSGSSSSFINNTTKFSSADYGVAASPRMTSSSRVPKGGGRYMVGQPYRVAGNWYRPAENTSYDETGTASWYGPNFHGRQTANGEIFDQFALTAAHPTLPLPSYVRVTNLSNGRSTIVRVNDRGPFANNRLIDLSRRTAEVLGYIQDGTAQVRVTYVGRAPVDGDDTRFLVASIHVPDGPIPPATGGGGTFSRQTGGLLGAFASLFSYAGAAQGEVIVNDAHAAAQAMAEQPSGLSEWVASVEGRGQSTQIPLGTYADPVLASELTRQFALLGAVDQQTTNAQGSFRVSLTMRHLKPGVTPTDVANLAETLGVDHNAAYNQAQ